MVLRPFANGTNGTQKHGFHPCAICRKNYPQWGFLLDFITNYCIKIGFKERSPLLFYCLTDVPDEAFVRPSIEGALTAEHEGEEHGHLLAGSGEPMEAALLVPDEIVLDVLAEKLRAEGVGDNDASRLGLNKHFLKERDLIESKLVQFLAVVDALHEIRLRRFLVEKEIDMLPRHAELLGDLRRAAKVLRIFFESEVLDLDAVVHESEIAGHVPPLEKSDRVDLPVFRVGQDGAKAANAERRVHADEDDGVLFELIVKERRVHARDIFEILVPKSDYLLIDGRVPHIS